MGRLFDPPEEEPAGREIAEATDLPLAARMRPRSLEEFVGQPHLLGPSSALRSAEEFRGPPPCAGPVGGAAARDPVRRAALDDPVRAAGHGQDDAGADAR